MENQQAGVANSETASVALSATIAKAVLDNIESESPARWPAAVKTLIVGAYQAVERVESAVANFTAAVSRIGSDLEWLKRDYVPRAEYDKLVASHKNLAKVVVGLQTEVRATKPQPTGGESQPPVPEPAAAAQSTEAAGSAAAPAAESAADAPAANMPQEDVEAVMDAAIMAAAGAAGTAGAEAPATPAFASPTGGARRRRS